MSWEESGRWYGYPECCIAEFVRTLGAMGASPLRVSQTVDGFVPCEAHAAAIARGETTHRALIQRRRSPKPFAYVPITQGKVTV